MKRVLADVGPCLVAFSGGVDSTLLLKVAHDVLGDAVTAVTAESPSLAAAEREEARSLAAFIGVAHRVVPTFEMEVPEYVANDGRRCYFCKRELFGILGRLAAEAGGRTVVYGAITDDLGDDRPGMLAAREAGVRAPLIEAGFDKHAVRRLARRLGLPNWDKPAMACLASRISRFTPVTVPGLARVERAEAAVRALGYRQVRVRLSGERDARVELDAAGLLRVASGRNLTLLVEVVRAAGFAAVTVDPRGYRGAVARAVPPPVS